MAAVDAKVVKPVVTVVAAGASAAAVDVNVTRAVVNVATAGPQGAAGPPGPPGPPGGALFVHTQSTLAKVWNITHNLGRHPAVVVEDQAGSKVYGSIFYLDDNRLTVTFANTTTGRANCT